MAAERQKAKEEKEKHDREMEEERSSWHDTSDLTAKTGVMRLLVVSMTLEEDQIAVHGKPFEVKDLATTPKADKYDSTVDRMRDKDFWGNENGYPGQLVYDKLYNTYFNMFMDNVWQRIDHKHKPEAVVTGDKSGRRYQDFPIVPPKVQDQIEDDAGGADGQPKKEEEKPPNWIRIYRAEQGASPGVFKEGSEGLWYDGPCEAYAFQSDKLVPAAPSEDREEGGDKQAGADGATAHPSEEQIRVYENCIYSFPALLRPFPIWAVPGENEPNPLDPPFLIPWSLKDTCFESKSLPGGIAANVYLPRAEPGPEPAPDTKGFEIVKGGFKYRPEVHYCEKAWGPSEDPEEPVAAGLAAAAAAEEKEGGGDEEKELVTNGMLLYENKEKDGKHLLPAARPMMPPWAIAGQFAEMQRWIYRWVQWSQEDEAGELGLTDGERRALRVRFQLFLKQYRNKTNPVNPALTTEELMRNNQMMMVVEQGPCSRVDDHLLQFRVRSLKQQLGHKCVFWCNTESTLPGGSTVDGTVSSEDLVQQVLDAKKREKPGVNATGANNEQVEFWKYGRRIGTIRKTYIKEDRQRLLDTMEQFTPTYKAVVRYNGAFDPSKGQSSNHRMSDVNMQVITNIASLALDLTLPDCQEDRVACYVKTQMEQVLGPTWHVLVGRSFGFCIGCDARHMLQIRIRHLEVVVWKCDPDPNAGKKPVEGST